MLRKLIHLLKELDTLCSVCNQCGMCQASCPVFLETKHEADVARGKITLINGLSSEILSNPGKVLNRLNRCLLCGACSSTCPRNVETLEIFMKARIIINEYTGLSFIKKILLKKIVSNPLVFNQTLNLLKKFQPLFFKQSTNDNKTQQARILTPFFKNRKIQVLPPQSFHSMPETTHQPTPKTTKTLNVIFFAGCIIDKVMPEVGLACIKALEHHNVNVTVLKEEGCCGMPSIGSGDGDSFNKLVEYNAELFSGEKVDYIITACATCTYAISKLWPVMYKGPFDSKVASIAEKTIDITQFISSNFLHAPNKEIKESNTGGKVITIHDPCHLKKSLDIYRELRQLIQSNPNYCLKEMERSDSCCGFGGTFNITNYALSSKIGARKCSDIEKSSASIVATGCPACMLQLKEQLAKNNKNTIDVKHVMEIYADSLE